MLDMSTISVQEMAQDPIGCLKRVEAGETLIVVRDDQPIAQLKPPPDPFDERLPYGEPPQLTAPEDIGKGAAQPRWAAVLAALAAENVWVEVDNVCAYLDHFSDAADGLVSIAQSTRKEFGTGVKLTLIINRDPEIDNKYLKLLVNFANYSPDILSRIDAILAAHHDELGDLQGYILVIPHFPRVQ
jgi:antitoxin (DNA-binding transcriptional repressor) of toxin-antitoxin stability system